MQPELSFNHIAEGTMLVSLSGDWKLVNALPSADDVGKQVDASSGVRQLTFDAQGLKDWDTGLLIFVTKVSEICSRKGIAIERRAAERRPAAPVPCLGSAGEERRA